MNFSCRILLVTSLLFAEITFAQEGYEIQVYASAPIGKGTTTVELHSNYTLKGSAAAENGVYPTHHIIHETVEIVHGWNDWFETGIYFFNSIGSGNRTNYVGSHIRPRISVPTRLNWPVGLSLSAEIGWQKRTFSTDESAVEIRPIIDKQWGKYYLSVNPTLEKSLHGLNAPKGFFCAPNVKASCDVSRKITLGLEYYGGLGPLGNFEPGSAQEHQLYLVFDLGGTEHWELNAGYGFALTDAGDQSIIKFIFGRIF